MRTEDNFRDSIEPDNLPKNQSTDNVQIHGLKRYNNRPGKLDQKNSKIKAPKNYKKAEKLIKANCTLDEIAKGAGISKTTAIKAKKYYEKMHPVSA